MTFSYANATFGHFVFTKLCQVRLLTDETGDLGVVWTVNGKMSFLLTLFAKPFRTFADVVIFAANFASLFWLMACGNPCWGLVAKRGQHSLDLFFFLWDLLVLRLHFFIVIGDITVVNIIRVVQQHMMLLATTFKQTLVMRVAFSDHVTVVEALETDQSGLVGHLPPLGRLHANKPWTVTKLVAVD